MAGGRKRSRSAGPIYGSVSVESGPGTYALEWTVEPRDARPAADALVEQARSRPAATDPRVVRRIWEHITQHTLTADRARAFIQRQEVSELANRPPIRVWAGAWKAVAEHPDGHLLLAEWRACSEKVSMRELNQARPSFLQWWPRLIDSEDSSNE